MKHYFKIFNGNFLIIAGMILLSAIATFGKNTWYWGSEGTFNYEYNEPDYATEFKYKKPEGLLGCRWFNYDNGWGERPIIFPGWDEVYEPVNEFRSQNIKCFEGSISSIMLHFEWPMQSSFNGLLGEDPTQIDYKWNYKAIKDFSDGESDNPDNRMLPDCSTSGSCSVADEIARLFIAVRTACNYVDNYDTLWEPTAKFSDILHTRFGYVNALCGNLEDPEILSAVIDNLVGNDTQKPQPVLAFNNYHMVVVDGYRLNTNKLGEQIQEFHVLNYINNFNRHWSYWAPIEGFDFDSAVYNLQPDIELPYNVSQNYHFSLGNESVPYTSSSRRKGSFYFSPLNNHDAEISIKIYLSVLQGQTWKNDTLLASDTIKLATGGVTSTPFYYDVPYNAQVKIRLELTNNKYSWPITLRTVMNDYDCDLKGPSDEPITSLPDEKIVLEYPNDTTKSAEAKKEIHFQWKSLTDEDIPLVPYVTIDSGRTYIAISTYAISSMTNTFVWVVPETLMTANGPTPLIGKALGFSFRSYADNYCFLKTKNYLAVISNTTAGIRPVKKNILKTQHIELPYVNLLGRKIPARNIHQTTDGLVIQRKLKSLNLRK